MSQFIFVVEIPPIGETVVGATVAPQWSKFLSEAAPTLKAAKGSKQLQPNAWLIPAENALPVLSAASALAHSVGLSYSSLFLPSDAVVIALDIKPISR